MEIKQINAVDPKIVDAIVSIHQNVLTDSFLNNFGIEFLKIIYTNLIQSSEIICLIAYEGNGIEGFALATKDYSFFLKSALSKNKLRAVYSMSTHVILRPAVVWKLMLSLPEILFSKDIPHAELQFIAITPKSQGKGLGSALMNKLKEKYRAEGLNEFYIGTKADNLLSNKFYQKIGCVKKYSRKYFGDKMNYYVYPIL